MLSGQQARKSIFPVEWPEMLSGQQARKSIFPVEWPEMLSGQQARKSIFPVEWPEILSGQQARTRIFNVTVYQNARNSITIWVVTQCSHQPTDVFLGAAAEGSVAISQQTFFGS